MDNKQGKLLLFGVAIFVASYFVRSIVTDAMQATYYHQRALQVAQQQALQEARKKGKRQPGTAATDSTTPRVAGNLATANPAGTITAAPDPSFSKLAGFWMGVAAIPRRGLCTMRLELKKTDEPGSFSGYPKLTCRYVPQLMSRNRATPAGDIINTLNPESAVLTGTPDGGALVFHVDKVLGADSTGCAFNSLTVTPAGTDFIDAAWKEQSCPGGHVVLRKVPRL